MDLPTDARTADDGSIRWLRILLAISVLAPALVFVASAWLDYQQTLELAHQRVDRAERIAFEHALKVFETSEIILGRVDDAVAGRDAEALRADAPHLRERLRAMAATMPQVRSLWVLDDAGRLVVGSDAQPAGAPPTPQAEAAFEQLRTGAASLVITGEQRDGSETFFTVSRPRQVDGRFAGAVGVSLEPAQFVQFLDELTREHDGISLLLYRADGSVIARAPAPPNAPVVVGPQTAWMSLMRAGTADGRVRTHGSEGARRLAALRRVGNYPVYLAAALPFAAIERDWMSKTLVTLGFAVAAMLALGAVSWMALRRTHDQYAVTREWHREAARRETAEKALRESQRMEAMGQLTGGVAHDFNNLLMVVSGNLQILRNRLGVSTHDRQLHAIGEAIQRGVTLTRHLLAFSRRQALTPRTIDLREMMPGLCELLSHSLRENVRLAWRVEPGTWPIKADPAELELALLNIAVNARDAMPDGGTLAIIVRNAMVADLLGLSGEMSGDFVLISMHDTGHGVPPDVLHRVFEPFFTTKSPGKGTGLGLSQVYGFSRQSGGTVTLQSPPGKGTTVTLWLPRSNEPLPEPLPARASATKPGAGTILLVEDDPEVSGVLRDLLAELGYGVQAVDTGSAALELLESGARVDLLLTDVVMIGALNGLQLARAVRARFPDLPIVVMTGYAAEVSRIAGEGHTVLTKPFDVQALAETIAAKLDREPMTRS